MKKLTKILIRSGRWEKLMLLNIKQTKKYGKLLTKIKGTKKKEGFGRKY